MSGIIAAQGLDSREEIRSPTSLYWLVLGAIISREDLGGFGCGAVGEGSVRALAIEAN